MDLWQLLGCFGLLLKALLLPFRLHLDLDLRLCFLHLDYLQHLRHQLDYQVIDYQVIDYQVQFLLQEQVQLRPSSLLEDLE